ncbi:GNAT family N-acetyltransferase [Thermaerobacter sp. FW80]|uniref:GNAT family N-acetyltransferase n=1 Tax=Thermaerobacter sp. FW80 TaxID=2546351 RepID=UPI0010751593|nr:GNAT family N-acetyltransferase [Thermaerobacter sp. FW80]QBS36912.1 GNAT family N-acetyltransferase [Thermaerobacter sp. FW80]
MIRRLNEADRQPVFDFLAEESAFNLFILADIQNYGFETDFQAVWGDFDECGRLRAVLLRYFRSFIPYGRGDFDAEGLARIIARHAAEPARGGAELAGKGEVVARLRPYTQAVLDWSRRRSLHFAELSDAGRLAALSGNLPVDVRPHRMTPADAPVIAALYSRIVEFHSFDDQRKRELRHSLETGAARGYWLEYDGRAVAAVKTAAENPFSAMIVGVATDPGFRRRGFATQLMVRLCSEVLAEGKRLCLFYDNPEAGAIYKRLGFRDIGRWDMVPQR